MTFICATRLIKNAKEIQKVAPHIIPAEEPREGFRSLVPLDVLKQFHSMMEADLVDFPELQVAKDKLRPPSATPELFGPLFEGTLHFVRMSFFSEADNSVISVSNADVQTAIRYATLAVQPISAYASAYGPNRLKVSPNVLESGLAVTSTRYNDEDVQFIVNSILHQNSLDAESSCIIILNPPEMTNTDADRKDRISGYHDKAEAPYCFVNLFGTSLTVKDTQGLYANALSHEIAEMTCDPDARFTNQEVCDGCAGNCDNSWRNFFDPNPSPANAYIKSARPFPSPSFPFTYFIASIAFPPWGAQCPTPDRFCAYAPPRNISDSELLWYNSSDGSIQLWGMDGAQVTGRNDVMDVGDILVGPPWQIVGSGDMDGNGKSDIVWHNGSDGSIQVWFMDGARIAGRSNVVDENGDPIFIGPPWQIVGAGDMDGNGNSDIVWHNSSDGAIQVWFMNSERISSRANTLDENGDPIFIGPPWQIVGTGTER